MRNIKGRINYAFSFFPEEIRKNIPRPSPAARSKEILVSIGTTRPGGGGFPGAQSFEGLQVPPQHRCPDGHELEPPGAQGFWAKPLKLRKNINNSDKSRFLIKNFIKKGWIQGV